MHRLKSACAHEAITKMESTIPILLIALIWQPPVWTCKGCHFADDNKLQKVFVTCSEAGAGNFTAPVYSSLILAKLFLK
jgi:hypothetical protein